MTLEEMRTEKLDLRSLDVKGEHIKSLLRIFPEVQTEGGKIDFDRLRLTLGAAVEVGKERYGINWPGKSECYKTIQAPSRGTLRPSKDQSINFDQTENAIVEGDNLEILKLLQKSYLGKIKMIFIDPPYNTGNDFIYPDNFSESLQTYLEYTGQVDAKGKKFGTNTETDGRFHSKWLNMMYPRLFLSRNLLRDDGVIFVSINDGEIPALRLIMNEIFGEENFIGVLVWKSRHNVDSRNKSGISSDHEYVICYGSRLMGQQIDEDKYSNPDGEPRGPWMSDNMVGLATRDRRPNLHYELVNPATGIVYACPEKGWRYDRTTMALKIKEGRVLWPASPDGRPRHKKFLNELRSQFTGFSSMLNVPNTSAGTAEIKELFGSAVFDFPKPVGLLEELVRQGTSPHDGDLVLDFFAGSGTTGHAVLKVNSEDGGNRKFLLIQLPEQIGANGSQTIADICRERIRKVISSSLNLDADQDVQSQNGKENLGFRSFKLAESNFVAWDGQMAPSPKILQRQLELYIEHIREERSSDDILFELLLKSGFPLTTPIDQEIILTKNVYSIAGGVLLICLESELNLDLIKEMAERKPGRVVCLDKGFARNDQLKANAMQIFKSKGVESFKTV